MNVTNVINTTALWKTNTTNSRNHFNNLNKKTHPRGAKEAPQTKRRQSHPRLGKAQPQRGRSTLKPRPKQQGSRQPQHQKGKADDTTNVVSNEHGRSAMRRRRSRSQLKKKTSSIDRNKQRLQSATT